ETETHPICAIEVPERLSSCYERLRRHGLARRCVRLPAREATEEDIRLVHSPEYLEVVKATQTMGQEELRALSQRYDAVYFHPESYRCARLAAGVTLQLVDAVLTGAVRNGMALVRPPGHHSQRDAANGFCVFNNVAVAARHAKAKHGLKRILIVDWDIHHGQGTQYLFQDDPSVLYFSWHRYEHQRFWPQLRESDYDAVGQGSGRGFNVNVPWNEVGMGNADYLAVFFHVLLPLALEFNPELVLVSAGYDSGIGDPEGEMVATPECFAHLTHLLQPLAGGRLCVVLEVSVLCPVECQDISGGSPGPNTETQGTCLGSLGLSPCLGVFLLGPIPPIRTAAGLASGPPGWPLPSAVHREEGPAGGGDAAALARWRTVPAPAPQWGQRGSWRVVGSDVGAEGDGLTLAIPGLLLPVAYSYRPDLVVLALGAGAHLDRGETWLLAGLLQGVAQGRILAVVQDSELSYVETLTGALLGAPPPTLGIPRPASPEKVRALEQQRQRLQRRWRMLRRSGEPLAPGLVWPGGLAGCPGGWREAGARSLQLNIPPLSPTPDLTAPPPQRAASDCPLA
uniref:Histone deacetylase domain-containing protein n=1 Tax=Ornithorhynchus anatinus TaxID=9258 RepID=A0A6I8NBU1_ORNAN